VQVESRVNLFTMPRRRRFKPIKDCFSNPRQVKLTSRADFFHKPNPYCLGLKRRLEPVIFIFLPKPLLCQRGACCKCSTCLRDYHKKESY